MVTVRHNEPAPVVQPPETYDLLGLSREQAAVIRDLVGKVSLGDVVDMQPVYSSLLHALPGEDSEYEITAALSYGTDRVRIIHAHHTTQE